jgi:hypothetical protein
MIFDYAVVNDCDAIDRMWMRVLFVGTAMSRPTRVADSYAANKRLTSELALEVLELSDCAPPRKATALKRGYTSGIVTPIFKPFQRIENRHHGWPLADETNDSAHLSLRFHHYPAAVLNRCRPRATTARCSPAAHPEAL